MPILLFFVTRSRSCLLYFVGIWQQKKIVKKVVQILNIKMLLINE
jgi:hypothetical protein